MIGINDHGAKTLKRVDGGAVNNGFHGVNGARFHSAEANDRSQQVLIGENAMGA